MHKKIKTLFKSNGWIVFALTTIYYMIWYSFLRPIVRCMVSSDEFLTIAIGVTAFTELDWSELVNKVNRFYGSGYTFLFIPVMLYVKSAVARYYIFHLVNSFLHGFIGLIAHNIFTRFLGHKDGKEAVLVGLVSSLFFFEGLEGTNVINELPLYFMVWVALYVILWLFKNIDDKKKRMIGTILLEIVMMYSLLLHTRAIFMIGGIFVTIFLLYVIYRKFLVSPLLFIVLTILCFLLTEYWNGIVIDRIWLEKIVQNTVEGAFSSTGVFSKIGLLFTTKGIRAFITTVVGRMFGMVFLSGGLILLGMIVAVRVWRKKTVTVKMDVEYSRYIDMMRVAELFLGSIIVASMLLFCLHGTNGVSDALEKQNVTYWAFYLRYHYLYCIPLLLFLYSYLIKGCDTKKILMSSFIGMSALVFCSIIFLGKLFVENSVTYSSKIVYFVFLPFVRCSRKTAIEIDMLYVVILVGIALFYIHAICIYLRKCSVSCLLSIATSVYIFAYVMLTVFIPESKHMYEKTEETYKYLENISIQEYSDKYIFYNAYTHLEAEVLQFELCKWKLTDDFSKMNPKNAIVVSKEPMRVTQLKSISESVIEICLDKEQYIYFIGEYWKDRLTTMKNN